ncbi:AraC family transcriptional regulator [Oleiagrimonas sp. C23AA]|uniref:AraC family transcriptional regulator n=1 Tax=Oleiagrimonas sp. C23AA TaxID=2719047 RepID=UPI00141F3215|nr:AraC family transcriptional regulator [Oleiagrimonas sp. C23AA]NII10556.1 AraC family transcriptional regulator [Oleiagrimonas sp. C23AA]
MSAPASLLESLVGIASRHAGTRDARTLVPGLSIWSAHGPSQAIPGLFEPAFYLLAQGSKRLTFADSEHDFHPGMCAVALVGLPFSSRVVEASVDKPYVGLSVRLDAGVISSLLIDMSEPPLRRRDTITIMQAEPLVLDALARLLALLDTPADIAVLAAQFEREFCYRLLQGPMGSQLREMGGYGARFWQIRKAAEWIATHANQPMSIAQLADWVGMSVTSFHRHFKAVTGHAPLAYQRYIRLFHARQQLASGAGNVTSVAFAVGYANASQFSREYKKCFGVPPVNDVLRSA